MPETRRVLRRDGDSGVRFAEEPIPARGTSDVLIRVHAVSLNYKDVASTDGRFPWPSLTNGLLGTEFAGEIIWAGEKVQLFEVGDRVIPLINLHGITGRESSLQVLGLNVDGTLAEYLVMPESALVKIPEHLTWAEASMLACAGMTAWTALNMTSRLFGKTVLIEGTGGVSIVALVLAVKAGATAIVTSSSDEKLERAKRLGASHVINYKRTPDWDAEVLKLTDGLGVDIVIEQGGASTLAKSMASVKRLGQVSQVGFLSDKGEADLLPIVQMLITKSCSIVGIQVGAKRDLEEFLDCLSLAKVKLDSCIDRSFTFDQAPEAFDYLRHQSAVGKVVIEF